MCKNDVFVAKICNCKIRCFLSRKFANARSALALRDIWRSPLARQLIAACPIPTQSTYPYQMAPWQCSCLLMPKANIVQSSEMVGWERSNQSVTLDWAAKTASGAALLLLLLLLLLASTTSSIGMASMHCNIAMQLLFPSILDNAEIKMLNILKNIFICKIAIFCSASSYIVWNRTQYSTTLLVMNAW